MGAGHDHGTQALHAGAKHRARLWWAAGLLAAFMVVEAVAAIATGSLALLSDAGHMFTDVLGIAMALAAITAAGRAADADSQRTFGLYRLEVLAALANAVLLTGVAVVVLVQAVRRFTDPPDVPAGSMLVVAVGGLVINLIAFALLRSGASESINVRGAYLEVIGDLLGSVGVIVAAAVIGLTGWSYADPIVAVVVALMILPRTVAPRPVRHPDPGPGRARAAGHHRGAGPAGRGPRRLRCARSARLDADLGHGRGLGPPEPGPGRRARHRADHRPRGAAPRFRHRPRHAAGRTGRRRRRVHPRRLVTSTVAIITPERQADHTSHRVRRPPDGCRHHLYAW